RRDRHPPAVVVSFVYEPSACSQAEAATRRPLQDALRGDGGDLDPLRVGDFPLVGKAARLVLPSPEIPSGPPKHSKIQILNNGGSFAQGACD
ncbi:unnamed protein product, partial [Urochloa humidicola]